MAQVDRCRRRRGERQEEVWSAGGGFEGEKCLPHREEGEAAVALVLERRHASAVRAAEQSGEELEGLHCSMQHAVCSKLFSDAAS